MSLELGRLTSGDKLAWSYNLLQTGEGPIEVVSCADQRQMGKCLGKISEMLTAWTEFLRIKAEVIGVTDCLFEKEARLLKITGAREAFHKPERTHIEGPFLAGETVGSRIADVIAIDK